MEVTSQHIDNVLVVRMEGRIDFSNNKEFEKALLPVLSAETLENCRVIFDLGGISYMSSAGLRVLMLAAKQLRPGNSEILMAGLQPLLREVFKISRLDMVFKVFDTVEEALAETSSATATVSAGKQ